jgi:hypothetical protein
VARHRNSDGCAPVFLIAALAACRQREPPKAVENEYTRALQPLIEELDAASES